MSKAKPFYLAGPMTGVPQFNFPLFDSACKLLTENGWDIMSPADLDLPGVREAAMASPDGAPGSGSPDGDTWGDFLSRDVKMVADECSGMILLPGWEKSRGARLECFVAILCDLDIKMYNGGKPLVLTKSGCMDAIAAVTKTEVIDIFRSAYPCAS